MKKAVLILITLSFTLYSCSKKDEVERVSPFKLLTKIVWYNNDVLQATDNYSYDDNDKITGYNISFPNNASISSNNIYDGDKLVRTNEYVNGSNNISKYFIYEYNGTNISKTSVFENGTLISENLFNFFNNQLTSSQKKEYTNGALSSSVIYDYLFNGTNRSLKKIERANTSNYIITFFDTKNHPFANTSYILPMIRTEGNTNYNNPTSIKHYANNALTKTLTIVNKYDNDGFLTKSSRTDTSNTDVFEVIYTYNK